MYLAKPSQTYLLMTSTNQISLQTKPGHCNASFENPRWHVSWLTPVEANVSGCFGPGAGGLSASRCDCRGQGVTYWITSVDREITSNRFPLIDYIFFPLLLELPFSCSHFRQPCQVCLHRLSSLLTSVLSQLGLFCETPVVWVGHPTYPTSFQQRADTAPVNMIMARACGYVISRRAQDIGHSNCVLPRLHNVEWSRLFCV